MAENFIYSSDLMCNWASWSVVCDGNLRLDLPKNNCCDMSAAIKMAQMLCPTVWKISVCVDGKLDVVYFLEEAGWEALVPALPAERT